MTWADWLTEQARIRDEAGLARRLSPRLEGDPVLDLAGNDYLGLSRHPDVVEAAVAAARTWGAGAGGSRLVTGSTQLHADLDRALAEFLGQPSALSLSTGYHANLSAVCALADREAVVISDAHVHASLIDAARLSRAEVRVTEHNAVGAVAEALRGLGEGRRALVAVESVYSVLGDAAPLAELAEVCAEHGALLLVDEAHALGVSGSGGHGLVHEAGLAGAPQVLVTATLSKALGSQGGVVAGAGSILDQLVNRARPFIYDTGLAPAAVGAAVAALGHLREHPELPEVVTGRIRALAKDLGARPPAGAVLSVPMSSATAALAAQQAALAAGVRVGCFRPPSTPDGISRLRITATAGLAEPQWLRACGVVREVVPEVMRG